MAKQVHRVGLSHGTVTDKPEMQPRITDKDRWAWLGEKGCITAPRMRLELCKKIPDTFSLTDSYPSHLTRNHYIQDW